MKSSHAWSSQRAYLNNNDTVNMTSACFSQTEAQNSKLIQGLKLGYCLLIAILYYNSSEKTWNAYDKKAFHMQDLENFWRAEKILIWAGMRIEKEKSLYLSLLVTCFFSLWPHGDNTTTNKWCVQSFACWNQLWIMRNCDFDPPMDNFHSMKYLIKDFVIICF